MMIENDGTLLESKNSKKNYLERKYCDVRRLKQAVPFRHELFHARRRY